MAETLELEIVTPERQVVKDRVTEVQVPGRNGALGILPGHAPLISELAIGEISYTDAAGVSSRLLVAWGFVEVLPERVTILAQAAERAEEVNVEHARASRERAQLHLKEAENTDQFDEACQELALAEARLAIAKQKPATAPQH
jgi:F-type H+-transporting ATPase subunit epsilon